MDEHRPKVLLVDDVEANVLALEALLADMQCSPVRAHNGNEALRLLLKNEFAVVLLDVQMPEMDGYEVAKYARQNPATRDVPIIFLTAMHDDEVSMLRGYGSGAVDFLFKPVNSYVLRAKVRIFLDLYLSRRALAQEVEAHRRTLSELQLSNTALHHFTNPASHDLRAPLRSIRSFLSLLAQEADAQLDDQARDYLARSRRAAERADSLLSALLTYARLRKPADQAEVDSKAIVEHVLLDLAEPIAKVRANVHVEELPRLRADPDRMYQLMLNLIANAIKFQRAGTAPEVRVSASPQAESWRFCVEDNGIGIDAAYQTKIFGAFTRLHAQSEFDGSGLGLTICQQIVEQHQGRIWVESREGEGARFCFELPRVAP
jgi:two-component system sensor histidine kinase/response regulator